MSFISSIFEKAKANLKTIAIPEYDNDYMMKAAIKAHRDQIANILLVGPAAEVQKRAEELDLDITGIRIADPEDADYTNGLVCPVCDCPSLACGGIVVDVVALVDNLSGVGDGGDLAVVS